MKRLIFIIITISISLISFSQKEYNIAVAPVKMNVFYIGVDNPVEIAVSGISNKDIIITISHGAIYKQKNGSYFVRVRKPENTIIRVSYKDKIIGTKEFRVKYIPEPIAELDNQGTKFGHGPQKTTLLGVRGIRVLNKNSSFNFKYEVLSFVVTVENNSIVEEAKAYGASFSQEQKDLIRKTKKSSIVKITEIRVKDESGTIRKVRDIKVNLW